MLSAILSSLMKTKNECYPKFIEQTVFYIVNNNQHVKMTAFYPKVPES
jgi:hypothetical protein